MSIGNDLANEVVSRLRSANLVDEVRRDHRTSVPLAKSPTIHVVDGDETIGTAARGCGFEAYWNCVVRIFTRADDGADALDALKVGVMAALSPLPPNSTYPHSALVKEGRISTIQEIADNDSNRCDMAFQFKYVRGEFSLGEPA